jgi:hypothetical protein
MSTEDTQATITFDDSQYIPHVPLRVVAETAGLAALLLPGLGALILLAAFTFDTRISDWIYLPLNTPLPQLIALGLLAVAPTFGIVGLVFAFYRSLPQTTRREEYRAQRQKLLIDLDAIESAIRDEFGASADKDNDAAQSGRSELITEWVDLQARLEDLERTREEQLLADKPPKWLRYGLIAWLLLVLGVALFAPAWPAIHLVFIGFVVSGRSFRRRVRGKRAVSIQDVLPPAALSIAFAALGIIVTPSVLPLQASIYSFSETTVADGPYVEVARSDAGFWLVACEAKVTNSATWVPFSHVKSGALISGETLYPPSLMDVIAGKEKVLLTVIDTWCPD